MLRPPAKRVGSHLGWSLLPVARLGDPRRLTLGGLTLCYRFSGLRRRNRRLGRRAVAAAAPAAAASSTSRSDAPVFAARRRAEGTGRQVDRDASRTEIMDVARFQGLTAA
jgi:hypothetical protein